MKKHLSTIAMILVLLVGLSLMLYPTVSDRWNAMHQSRAISSYSEAVSGMENTRYDELLAQAQAYNAALTNREGRFMMTDEERAVYKRGRNAKVNSVPQHADTAQYHAATGLETLFGWLYLLGRTQRLRELFSKITEVL